MKKTILTSLHALDRTKEKKKNVPANFLGSWGHSIPVTLFRLADAPSCLVLGGAMAIPH